MIKAQGWKRKVAAWVAVILCLNSTIYRFSAGAEQAIGAGLPVPVMVGLSSPFVPVCLKGLRVHPENPFQFDFIIDQGDSGLVGSALSGESARLVKYFLSSLAIPESDLWVNLSPYGENQIIPETFGRTEMGQDLLAQDFILKKLTAGLLHPDSESGRLFWEQVSAIAGETGFTSDHSTRVFHKVWIMPERAKVYEREGVAVVVESRLKVMLEDDYRAVSRRSGSEPGELTMEDDSRAFAAGRMRELILPVIEREVNEGERFASLRQIYSAFILATWFKKKCGTRC